jgi:hypothetical protein
MLASFIVAYTQFQIRLIELKAVLIV